jgi:hypothetical protein
MPLLTEPFVTNQKTSPSGAESTAPRDKAGMFPVPLPLIPWQDAQFVAYNFAPAAMAACCPANGFFNCELDAGAL